MMTTHGAVVVAGPDRCAAAGLVEQIERGLQMRIGGAPCRARQPDDANAPHAVAPRLDELRAGAGL